MTVYWPHKNIICGNVKLNSYKKCSGTNYQKYKNIICFSIKKYHLSFKKKSKWNILTTAMETPKYKVYQRVKPEKQTVTKYNYNNKVSRYLDKIKDPTTNSENRTQKWFYWFLTTTTNDI